MIQRIVNKTLGNKIRMYMTFKFYKAMGKPALSIEVNHEWRLAANVIS